MNRFGFSLKWLLAAVSLTAVGLTALFNASWVWTSGVVSLTLLVLLAALLAVPCRPSPLRAFWLGFAIFGWGYLVVLHTPLGETYRARSPTTAVLDKAYQAIRPEVTSSASPDVVFERIFERTPGGGLQVERVPARPVFERTPGGGLQVEQVPARPAIWDGPRRSEFLRLGHYLWAWLLALVGGFLGRYFYVVQQGAAEKQLPQLKRTGTTAGN